MPWVTISMQEIVGGVVRHHDLVAKIKIAKYFFLACLLVICENLCLRKFPAIRYQIKLPEYVSSAHCISIAQPPILPTVKGIILIMLIVRSLQAHELTEYPARVPCKYPVPYKHIMSSQYVCGECIIKLRTF